MGSFHRVRLTEPPDTSADRQQTPAAVATAVAAGHFQDLEKIRESDFICFPSLFPEGESKMGWGWGSGGQTSRRPASLGATHLEGPFFASLPPSFVHTSKQTRHVGQWWLSFEREGEWEKKLRWLAGSEAAEGTNSPVET